MSSPRDPTQFTRESAQRIGRVVRAAELSPRPAAPLAFDRVDAVRRGKVFRVATFTGAWSIGASKAVTFKNQTTTPNTASVTNLFFPITNTAAGNRDCGIAKDGTAWYLIDVRLATATGVFASSTATHSVYTAIATTQRSVITSLDTVSVTALSSIELSATLNSGDCTITIAQTAQTQQFTVVSGTPATQTVTVLTGEPAATSITVFDSTHTATFLTFGG